jgi:type IX secretion system PorP/SprF family membrane protein
MKLKTLLSFAILMLAASFTQAQDIHFSQFYMSPTNLNPALTGVMNCNGRATFNYRSQWQSVLKTNAFKTTSASYDGRTPVGRSDFFGYGFTLSGDQAGSSSFQTTHGKFSMSYSKKMGGTRKRSHYLVAGAEMGLAQRSVNFLEMRFGSQFDGEGYNVNLPTNENFTRESFIFGDLGGGLLWFTVLDENTNFYGGASFVHLNAPNQSFNNDGSVQLASRIAIHAGGEMMFNRRIGLVPGLVIFSQGPAMEINGGTSVKFVVGKQTNDYQAFLFGVWGRLAKDYQSGLAMDAVIFSTRFDFNNMTFGFSYDTNVSALKPASNGNGGFELALAYKICKGFSRNVYCPRF